MKLGTYYKETYVLRYLSLSPTTVQGYESSYHLHVEPQWADWEMHEIRVRHINAWLATAFVDNPGGAEKAYKVLRQILRAAMGDEEYPDKVLGPCFSRACPHTSRRSRGHQLQGLRAVHGADIMHFSMHVAFGSPGAPDDSVRRRVGFCSWTVPPRRQPRDRLVVEHPRILRLCLYRVSRPVKRRPRLPLPDRQNAHGLGLSGRFARAARCAHSETVRRKRVLLRLLCLRVAIGKPTPSSRLPPPQIARGTSCCWLWESRPLP